MWTEFDWLLKSNQSNSVHILTKDNTVIFNDCALWPKFVPFLSLKWMLYSDWLLASKERQNLYDIYLMLYVQSSTSDDGRRDRPKHVECCSKIK